MTLQTQSTNSYDDIQVALTNVNGRFSFEDIAPGRYLLSTPLGLVDSIVDVRSDIDEVVLCFDEIHRPVDPKLLNEYRQKAHYDIQNENLKILIPMVGLIMNDPFEDINRRVIKKFGFKYEVRGCQSAGREYVVYERQFKAYNDIMYEHLDSTYGSNWWTRVRFERKRRKL